MERRNAVISLRGLYKSFGDNHVLRGVDLDKFEKENVVVLGRSGTGKSVLIKIIIGLLKPDKGSMIIWEREICKLSGKAEEDLRLKIGFLFQEQCTI